MRQLEPGTRKLVRELGGVRAEALADGAVARVDLERDVAGEHDRWVANRRVVRVGDSVRESASSGYE